MDQGLRGKRVLVTGGTRGIGRATVLAFAQAGAHVLACHHTEGEDSDSLARELKELGDRNRVVRADVTDSADNRRLAGTVEEELGGLDVLVNNVGVDGSAPFATISGEEWQRLLDYNVTSAYLVTQAMLGVLADGASVVNIGASAALRGRPNAVHYSASKAALVGFTRGLCKELGPRGIRVNLVAPGLTETEPGAGLPPQAVERIVAITALGRLCRPNDVAGAVLFLAGDTSQYISGVTLNVDGGI
ncbi:3-oxoacyl-[acyl-carrier protein] reductase [[Actinomadura] parvosata subsp. kistnae]|uniref:Short-chain dehydrogenase n=1 Tax=[Actinomadura] parvosata subsp. kistnae TaxID=1909395 RepID=A0A1V0A152_9ACTN|nr:SDR family NAD(P)-dependent oxidoreductase [Nonomuraea sp. ATCC 55076]AQZ63899.1 short-chain dehydrogenase [Nonomuraea sp. ATCC 55076]SPL89746.1 3-oxoacyl-[acyl-carrier protein] reductase [Actinomadura parvosata subsp. kistnae]